MEVAPKWLEEQQKGVGGDDPQLSEGRRRLRVRRLMCQPQHHLLHRVRHPQVVIQLQPLVLLLEDEPLPLLVKG